MWPIIGLKSAVIVVGGSETEEEGEGEEENGKDGGGGGSDDGTSGKVVNRMPVDTVRRLVGLATFCYYFVVMKGHEPPVLFSLALK